MFCKFQITDLGDGTFRHDCMRTTCTNSITAPTSAPLTGTCRGISEGKRLFNFSVAGIKHVLNRMPTCTQEEINARLTICRACPLYKKITEDLGFCTHADCGCSIHDFGGFVNKVAWRDAGCPIHKWPDLTQISASGPTSSDR